MAWANGSHVITATAVDAAGNSASSAVTVSVSNSDTVPPSAPANLSAVYGHSVDLSWSASTDNVGVAGYSVVRDGVKIGQTTSTTYADTAVTASVTYTYEIIAVDAAGNQSAPSNTSTITVPLADT